MLQKRYALHSAFCNFSFKSLLLSINIQRWPPSEPWIDLWFDLDRLRFLDGALLLWLGRLVL